MKKQHEKEIKVCQLLDMRTAVLACPGKRTTGTGAGRFAIVPPGWTGDLPDDIGRIDALGVSC